MKPQFMVPTLCFFNDDQSIDYDGTEVLFASIAQAGLDGVLVGGSSGEFFHLTAQEKLQLAHLAKNVFGTQARVYLGTGGMDAGDTLNLSKQALAANVDGIMLVLPYYFSLSSEEILEYYDNIAYNIEGNIIVYNIPAFTGNDVRPDLLEILLEKHPNICGYKDSVVEFAHTREVLSLSARVRPGFEVYSGFDEYFAHNVLAGGAGCIGALGNIVPELCAAWRDAVDAGRWDEISALQIKIDKLMGIYEGGRPFMASMRYALALRGMSVGQACRAPFRPPTNGVKAAVRACLEELDLLE